MKCLGVAAVVLLHIWHIKGAVTVPPSNHGLAITPRASDRLHARDVFDKRAGRDCGTWTFYCGGVPNDEGTDGRGQSAEGACNNACYYINFQESGGEYTATYSDSVDNAKSREQSGCQTDAGSVCNNMPFSQKFHDPFERLVDTKKQAYSCDEFPMAEMVQNDFSEGRIRNTLRCIPGVENSSGGNQLKNFIDGTGSGLEGRDPKCSGALQNGDTYKIAFNYDGADTEKLNYCKYPGNSPSRNSDSYQFYMTKMQGQHGLLHFPYDTNRDNHYALATSAKDVLLCRVEVLRTSGDNYDATVFDVTGDKQGHEAKSLNNDGDVLTVKGQNGIEDLDVIRQGEMGEAGTKGSKINFNYGDFDWSSDTQGSDGNYAKQDSDIYQPGGYCKVPNIDENEDGDSQTVTCYFPCMAS